VSQPRSQLDRHIRLQKYPPIKWAHQSRTRILLFSRADLEALLSPLQRNNAPEHGCTDAPSRERPYIRACRGDSTMIPAEIEISGDESRRTGFYANP
jgi:hypothetical protein